MIAACPALFTESILIFHLSAQDLCVSLKWLMMFMYLMPLLSPCQRKEKEKCPAATNN